MTDNRATQERALFSQARDLVHHTIREWYPNDLVIATPEGVNHGNVCARIFAWSQVSTGLATQLNDLAGLVDGDYRFDHVVGQARRLIGEATKALWAAAHLVPLPIHPHLGAAEEFEVYRISANTLAVRLAALSAQCLGLEMAAPASDPAQLPETEATIVEGEVQGGKNPGSSDHR